MPVATAHTITLQGAVGHLVDVEVDVSPGLVGTHLIGRPDAAITESRDRIRAAVSNSGLKWPNTRRTTILLSPADIPKRGPHFDLPLAVGVLAAAGQVPSAELRDTVLLGELSLDGRLRCVRGLLPMVMSAAARGVRRVFVPEPQAREARLVPGLEVLGVRSLGQVVAMLRQEQVPEAPAVTGVTSGSLLSWRGDDRLAELDMSDLQGIADARYALEVAAAGGHHLLLSGPKGAGKTSLAERLPGILPDLTLEESLELTAVASLAQTTPGVAELLTRPPFIAPHHNASRNSLLGGGTGQVRPGAVSRAHNGVLFLDEFPLFQADLIEALRQPLESGEVTIARGDETATYPAGGMVVLACNPCPCGNYAAHAIADECLCEHTVRRNYRRKLEGPVVDRIDITRHLVPVPKQVQGRQLPFEEPESSADVRTRVGAARTRQAERYAGRPWRLNGQVPGPALRELWPLTDEAGQTLDQEVLTGALTRRGATRVQRVAWSVADLRGVDRPGMPELRTALRLRSGEPLDELALRRAG